MRLSTIGFWGVSLSLLVPACGGSSDSDFGGSSVAIEDVPPLYAGAYCKVVEACFGPLLNIFLAGESCTANTETSITDELPRIKQAIDKGTIVYDGSKMNACISALEQRGCSMEEEPAECTAALDGTIEIGSECDMDAECKGAGTYCKTDTSCPGKCAAKELAGGNCERDSDCAAGLSCSDANNKCFVPAPLGAACEGGGTAPDCAAGGFCIGSDDDGQKPGKCMSIAEAFAGKAGEACFFDGKPACSPELRCIVTGIDATAGKILTECGQPFAAGAACKVAIPDGCPTDEYCKVASANDFNGTCTPRPKAGEACASLFDDFVCAPGTRCDAGSCKPLQKLGGQCSGDEVCYSGNCSGNGCAPAGSCT